MRYAPFVRCASVTLLILVGCTAAPAGEDGSLRRDAGDDVGDDAGPPIDAADWDGSAPRLDPTRPLGARTLHPACDVWSYDLDDPTTYDSAAELVVALADARCRAGLRCGERGLWCDPLVVQRAAFYVRDIDVVIARACIEQVETAACDALGNGICAGLARHVQAPRGAACGSGGLCENGPCSDSSTECGGTCREWYVCDTPCAADEYCAFEGRCTPLGDVGIICPDGRGCAAGLDCDPIYGRCNRFGAVGEPCTGEANPYDPTQIFYFCAHGALCDDTHVCRAPVVAAPGEACGGIYVCDAESDCVDGTCSARPGLGEPCTYEGRSCTTGLLCNQDMRCGRPVGPGCACDDTSACMGGFVCEAGRCVAIAAAASTPCASSADCGGRACEAGACVVMRLGAPCSSRSSLCEEGYCRGVCVPFLEAGAACGASDVCAYPHRCEHGRCALVTQSICYTPPP